MAGRAEVHEPCADEPGLPDAAAVHRIHGAAAPAIFPPWLPMHQSVGHLQPPRAFPAVSVEVGPGAPQWEVGESAEVVGDEVVARK
jgi:hypothetical protein